MPLLTRRDKPVSELSDRALERKVAEASRRIERMPTPQDGRDALKLLPELEAATEARRTAQDELDRREQAHRDAEAAAFRRRVQVSRRTIQAKALDAAARFAHCELAGTSLDPSRLDDKEAQELLRLASRRRGDEGTEPLTKTQERRYVALVEQAAGEPGLFERRRTEAAGQEKLAALRAAERRDPRRETITAAVLADPTVFDGLRTRLREQAAGPDEYGRWQPEHVIKGEVYLLDHIAALFLLLHALHENGGTVVVTEHGSIQGTHLEGGLPFLPHGSLGQLIRTGLIAATQTEGGRRVTYGPETRRIAEQWRVQLPQGDGSN